MSWEESFIVELSSPEFLDCQRRAGKVVAECLKKAQELIEPGINLLTIEEVCNDIILKNDCTPTFYLYKGFPGKICISVNNELVHGIPRDYVIQQGDVIKVDLGATYKGAIADAARTFICPKANVQHIELSNICKQALENAIKQVGVGKKIGCIGNAIYRSVRDTKFGLVTEYGGHAIQKDKPHAAPFIANKAKSDEGVRIQEGMTLAIEPMLTLAPSKLKVLADNWTVMAENIAVHFEDTIYIHKDKVEILTQC